MAGVITQGVRPDHPVLDIACASGTAVHAAHDVEALVERTYTHGITVVLAGPGGLQTCYSHLQQALATGPVQQGERIGLCGSTGISSTGPLCISRAIGLCC
ncbi:MAG: M23 family metallopeptidase [Vulcanococcus sp.]